MSYLELGKILMKWSLESSEYDLAYYLYTEHGIGVPAKMMYAMPEQRKFGSVVSFLGSDGSKGGSKELNRLLRLFPRSKWICLKEWEGTYGYRF